MNYQDIVLEATDGKSYALKDFKKKIVLFFYPKDNTPGCSTQAQEYTMYKDEFEKNNAIVIGVSRDSIASHHKFIESKDLNILLLSDSEEKLCKAFDVIKEKTMFGKTAFGIERSSFILDEDANIIEEYRKVKAPGNAKAMLDRIIELNK
ncbi:peroxiredoxin [Erysipelotrichaceae bacterium OttesenSCG-928-M19]|nr:peroxiredoxin [Erysipelotrichaceae bacterium OttesenSCG-928-M19]